MKLNTVKLGLLTLGIFAFTVTMSAQEKKGTNYKKKFNKIDADADGSISEVEFKSVKRTKEVSDEKLTKGFAKMDKDQNASVSLEEFTAAAKRRAKRKAKKAKQ